MSVYEIENEFEPDFEKNLSAFDKTENETPDENKIGENEFEPDLEKNLAALDKTVNEEIKPETVIYTGPNVREFALKKYQVFRNGLPPNVNKAIEKFPEIKKLIVPVGNLEDTRNKIKKTGTEEARFFYVLSKKILKEF